MCGIVGAFLTEREKPVPIQEMTEALRHRGPDDEGYLFLDPEQGVWEQRGGRDTDPRIPLRRIDEGPQPSARFVMGHRRLSIIDLTTAGHQPMSDSKKQVWITYNGEIYNYLELRRELESEGVRFFSHTDTEVILESYKKWGPECLHRFNGMWAFALWDSQRKLLFCSRDRFGVKPFYYAWTHGNFYFASEIKALLLVPGISKKLSEEAIFDFLACGLLEHSPQTFFAGIHSLEPGHFITVDLQGRFTKKKWYSLPQTIGGRRYQKETTQEFLERFSDAVRLRLRSDVQVGSCLSGGLDSSSIVCLASRYFPSSLQTFSSCFEDPRYDERPFHQPVAEKAGASPHLVFPTTQGFWKEWPELVRAQEEPFGSTSLYAHWCVMREAARHKVPVLLNGQGGDELLGGYPRYQVNRVLSLMRQGKAEGFYRAFKDFRAFAVFFALFLPRILRSHLLRVFVGNHPFLQKDFLKSHRNRHREFLEERIQRQKNLNISLEGDFLTYILPALLRYEDKNSMHFSVEVRLPFMDYRLVEWVFGLEESAKIEKGVNKRILRESMRGILPEPVRLRSDKMGFVTPQSAWLEAGCATLLGFFKNSASAWVSPWVDTLKIRGTLLERRTSLWTDSFWRVVNLEMWLRTFQKDPAGKRLSEVCGQKRANV